MLWACSMCLETSSDAELVAQWVVEVSVSYLWLRLVWHPPSDSQGSGDVTYRQLSLEGKKWNTKRTSLGLYELEAACHLLPTSSTQLLSSIRRCFFFFCYSGKSLSYLASKKQWKRENAHRDAAPELYVCIVFALLEYFLTKVGSFYNFTFFLKVYLHIFLRVHTHTW